MFSLKAKDLYDVCKPLHCCSKILGLTAFAIKSQSQVYVAATTWFNILCVMLSTALNVMCAWKFLSRTKMTQNNMIGKTKIHSSETYAGIMMWLMLSFLVVLTFASWWTFFSRKQFSNLFNLVQEVDSDQNTKKSFWWSSQLSTFSWSFPYLLWT